MEYKTLIDFNTGSYFHHFMEVYKMMFTNMDLLAITIPIVIFSLMVAAITTYVTVTIFSINKCFFLYIISCFSLITLCTTVLLTALTAVGFLKHYNYYGCYEAEVHPTKVHVINSVNGKNRSIVTLQDKNKHTIKLELVGQKVSRKDSIKVVTQPQLFEGRENKYKAIDYSNKGPIYDFKFKGQNLDEKSNVEDLLS